MFTGDELAKYKPFSDTAIPDTVVVARFVLPDTERFPTNEEVATEDVAVM